MNSINNLFSGNICEIKEMQYVDKPDGRGYVYKTEIIKRRALLYKINDHKYKDIMTKKKYKILYDCKEIGDTFVDEDKGFYPYTYLFPGLLDLNVSTRQLRKSFNKRIKALNNK